MNIGSFLQMIGLNQYHQAMIDNGVEDLEILSELNEVHLEKIGLRIGHRIKLLKALRTITLDKGNNRSD